MINTTVRVSDCCNSSVSWENRSKEGLMVKLAYSICSKCHKDCKVHSIPFEVQQGQGTTEYLFNVLTNFALKAIQCNKQGLEIDVMPWIEKITRIKNNKDSNL